MKKKTINILILTGTLVVLLIGIPFIKNINTQIAKFEEIQKKANDLGKGIQFIKDSSFLYDLRKNETILFSLNKSYKKPKILHFWATYCKPCIDEFEELEKFHKQNDFELYLISTESLKTQIQFLKSKEYDLPFYLLKEKNFFLSNHNFPLPFTIIINKDNSFKSKIGKIDWSKANKE